MNSFFALLAALNLCFSIIFYEMLLPRRGIFKTQRFEAELKAKVGFKGKSAKLSLLETKRSHLDAALSPQETWLMAEVKQVLSRNGGIDFSLQESNLLLPTLPLPFIRTESFHISRIIRENVRVDIISRLTPLYNEFVSENCLPQISLITRLLMLNRRHIRNYPTQSLKYPEQMRSKHEKETELQLERRTFLYSFHQKVNYRFSSLWKLQLCWLKEVIREKRALLL